MYELRRFRLSRAHLTKLVISGEAQRRGGRGNVADKPFHLILARGEGSRESHRDVARTTDCKGMDISTDTVTDDLRPRER